MIETDIEQRKTSNELNYRQSIIISNELVYNISIQYLKKNTIENTILLLFEYMQILKILILHQRTSSICMIKSMT